MAILEALLDIEKTLLGVVNDVLETGSEAVGAAVKAAADGVHEVIETLGGAVKGD